jgi:hypothetical protein
VSTQLESNLRTEESKEVIPAAAVYAGKHAESLILRLVRRGNDLRRKVEANAGFDGKREWLGFAPTLPTPVAALTQCLLEGAEATTETLTSALQLVAFFAQGCRSREDWQALSTGPYGKELLQQAWLLYEPMQWPEETWLRNTCAVLAAFRHESVYGFGARGQDELKRRINSEVREDVGIGLLTCGGLLWTRHGACADVANAMLLEDIESRLSLEDPALCEAAIWAWASVHRERKSRLQPSPRILSRLKSIWLGDTVAKRSFHAAAYALCQHMGLPRSAWSPMLTEAEIRQVRIATCPKSDDPDVRSTSLGAALMVAFHARSVWTDDDLGALLVKAGKGRRLYFRGQVEDRNRLTCMLEQMGEIGKQCVKQLERA